MKELKLNKVSVLKFENKLIIPLDIRWCKIFRDENPNFYAKIDKNGNLILMGPQVKQQPTNRNHNFSKEVS